MELFIALFFKISMLLLAVFSVHNYNSSKFKANENVPDIFGQNKSIKFVPLTPNFIKIHSISLLWSE